jgi:hypothetical protein
MSSEDLKVESETYEAHKAELLSRGEGKHVVISGTNILGLWDSYDEALDAAYEACDIGTRFMVKKVVANQPVRYLGYNLK